MKVKANHVLTALAVGLCSVSISGAAQADNDTSITDAALRQVCMTHDGRFELSWRYNDQGVKWGRVVSCSTKLSKVTCQGEVCRSDGETVSNNLAGSFPAEPVAFSNALAALSKK